MKDKESVRVDLNIYTAELENEYAATEPNLRTELSSESPCKEAIDTVSYTHLDVYKRQSQSPTKSGTFSSPVAIITLAILANLS